MYTTPSSIYSERDERLDVLPLYDQRHFCDLYKNESEKHMSRKFAGLRTPRDSSSRWTFSPPVNSDGGEYLDAEEFHQSVAGEKTIRRYNAQQNRPRFRSSHDARDTSSGRNGRNFENSSRDVGKQSKDNRVQLAHEI